MPQNYSNADSCEDWRWKDSTMHATLFWILFPKFGIWTQGSGAAGYVSSVIYFSNLFGRQRKEDSKSRWTLSLIRRFNLRLEDYSIWSVIFNAPHIEDYFWRFEIYSGKSATQPRSNQKSTQRTQRWFQKYSEACSTRLRSARGLVRDKSPDTRKEGRNQTHTRIHL